MKFKTPNNTKLLTEFIFKKIKKNDMIVTDMTLGNGHDSLNILNILKGNGFLYSFDIQDIALENSKKLLKNCVYQNYNLIKDNHKNFDKYIEKNIDIGIFNLGYLPGGDKNITTKAEDVLICLEKLIQTLNENGIILITLYPGHESGKEEIRLIESFFRKINQKNYNIIKFDFINQKNNPPYILLLEKKGDE